MSLLLLGGGVFGDHVCAKLGSGPGSGRPGAGAVFLYARARVVAARHLQLLFRWYTAWRLSAGGLCGSCRAWFSLYIQSSLSLIVLAVVARSNLVQLQLAFTVALESWQC